MPPDLVIDRFAYHFVDPRLDAPRYTPAEQDLSALPQAIQRLLLQLVAEIWDAPDAGSTRSARFTEPDAPEAPETPAIPAGTQVELSFEPAPSPPPPQLTIQDLLQSLVQPVPDQAGPNEAEASAPAPALPDFYTTSRSLAAQLHAAAPQNASPGVLVVLRLLRTEDLAPFVALLKIRYRDEEFVHLLTGDTPHLEVAQVENILLKEIQKGALLPHPQKREYDLKVIDAQTRDDPAAYFTDKFLGCAAKKSDDLQIKKLAPFLERYAEEKDLPLALEKVAHVFQELRQQPENISAPVLREVVERQELFGSDFEVQDFEEFIEENELGELDIPPEEFQHNRKSSRRLVYRFLDPEYEGLEISGPPEAFSRVLNSENGAITFTILTTPGGFKFGYQ